jgi:hypothetical protein
MTGFEETKPESIVYLWTRGVVWTLPDQNSCEIFAENRSHAFQWVWFTSQQDNSVEHIVAKKYEHIL